MDGSTRIQKKYYKNNYITKNYLDFILGNGGLGLNCAGSLINQRYVLMLTAAHCVSSSIESQIGEL